MAVITGGRFARGVQKVLGIKGETVIPDLDSALQAGFDVSALEDALDKRIMFGWRSYTAGPATSAVAAQNSVIAMVNPALSGVILVIERWLAYELGVFDPTIGLFRGAVTGASRGLSRDSRSRSGAGTLLDSVGLWNIANNQGGGTTFGQIPADAIFATLSTYKVIENPRQEITLMPGDQVEIRSTGVNLILGSTISWRERAFDPEELKA